MASPRRRSQLLADNDNDVSTEGLGEIRAEDEDDRMVTVSIERDFTLTGNDHKPVEYKAGIDEMPLSHANHWFAKNAGGVKLYVPRRGKSDAPKADEKPAVPPQPDPSKLPDLSANVTLGVDNTKL